MAEKLVSPGVFTKENDLSFLQQGVAEIGAAFIGPFKEGPLVPTIVNSQTEFQTLFGEADGTYYTPLAVQNYLREAGTATICRVAGIGGYKETRPLLLIVTSGSVSASVGVLYNTSASLNAGFVNLQVTASESGEGHFVVRGTGFNFSSSVDPVDTNSLLASFGSSPYGTGKAYVHTYFQSSSVVLDSNAEVTAVALLDQDYRLDAQEAITPLIQSQLISNQRYDLFQIETIGAGTSANTKVKISISNIKAAGTVAGSDYGSFNLSVRAFDDTDKKKNVLETFANVNLDPNSPNFISRVIGDRKLSIDNYGKITENGDWVNNSKYIRIANLNENVPVQAVPFGHKAYKLPVDADSYDAMFPGVQYSTGSANQANTSYFAGIILDNSSAAFNSYAISNNLNFIKPIPVGAGYDDSNDFGLDVVKGGEVSVGNSHAQFTIAFQEGFDGMNPATVINKGSDINAGNSQGFNLTNSTSSGSVAYMKAINALSNADEWDINMVIAPGVMKNEHSYVHQAIVDMVEQRADAFFITEMTYGGKDNMDTTITKAGDLDTNYAATYYPWIKTIDVNTNKLITVPPSVLLPGVFAANDRVAAEWFAPAGLNRGGLVGAVSVLNRLTQSEKDELYEGKVNPICQFPGQGIVVFGQKTLQDKPSALDRINVRRLLLTVRKYIASTSRYLVFEQNSSETRNRFLNIVNPYLESIQQRQGLYAFRVVMDESNNTPDVIDRNILKGAIYLQPTKTAEFIQIDFNILPTGAAFNG